jgi:surface antigen
VTAPAVAAPFGIFEPTPRPEPTSQPTASARAEATPVVPVAAAVPRRHTVRKRFSVAGTMVLVGGLFASLTLPAYASADYNAVAADAAPEEAQKLALTTASVDVAAASGDARDGYEATSAADLKRLYQDAVRQQNLAAYLSSGAMEMGDDYPWATELADYQGGGLSPLNYFYRECVDFVAWRLNRDAGSTAAPFKWVWSSLTPGAGSARSWKSQWEKHGWPISTTPAPGWVAWFPGANHVAYVSGILDDGTVAIEEYNWGPNIYNQRVIQPGEAIYLSPPPA